MQSRLKDKSPVPRRSLGLSSCRPADLTARNHQYPTGDTPPAILDTTPSTPGTSWLTDGFIKRISLHDGVRKGHRKHLTQGLHSFRDLPLDVDDTRTQMFPRDEWRVTAWKAEKTKFPLGMDRYDL
ncbi:Hypothetical predicted protein, partial [Pelobates cultripes]